MIKADSLAPIALPKSVNSVDSTKVDHLHPACDLVDEKVFDANPLPQSQALSESSEVTKNNFINLFPSVVSKLITLIHELRSTNSHLLYQVDQVEQTLAESQTACAATLLVTEQEPKVAVTEELEVATQTIQNQQILIETLTAQLQISQARIVELENEHCIIQAKYKQKSHQLRESENAHRELSLTLTRQKNQSRQLKIALEKCIDSRLYNERSHFDSDNLSTDDLSQQTKSSCLDFVFPKDQSIIPWSTQTQFSNHGLGSIWDKPLTFFAPETLSSLTPDITCAEIEEAALLEACNQPSLEDVSNTNGQFEEQAPLAVNTPLVPLAELQTSKTDTEAIDSLIDDVSSLVEVDWQELVNLLAVESDSATADIIETTTASLSPLVIDNSTEQLDDYSYTANPAVDELVNMELEPAPAECITESISLESEINSSSFNAGYPSPTIYPSRPSKGRKSLAAIELPTFVHNRGNSQKND